MSKKNFRGNNPAIPEHPAMAFIGPSSDTHSDHDKNKETKSRKIKLLMRPTLYGKITQIAHIKNLSINELITQAVEEYAKNNTELLRQYDEFIKLNNPI